ncbi:MAG TPA: efflux RND transporter periplasmic adaptor subunit [Caulobacteraceae bacterium]|jgi:multidrug efflux system membrane fusion protein|nr:efflux RND transporter periplasmic adaptor subunit [Caulobacteraceae bacterium]
MTPPRRFRWGFALLGAVLVGLIAWLALGGQPAKPAHGAPPVPVTVAKATTQDVPVTVTALGAAQAWQSVLIVPQVSGRLTYVAQEGQDVRAGALLVQIDCGPYQAALTQAQGQLRRDQATLEGARRDLARYQTLVGQNSIARQTAEDQAATVKQEAGTVLADQGAVQAAVVNVRYCRIASPVDGRVGVRLVDPGNVVSTAGTTAGIVSVNQIQPIAVTFTVPQGDFQRLVAASDGFRRPLTTTAASQETGAQLGSGELVVADNHVDPATGTVQMKAKFPNPGRELWPGQFVNVNLTLQTLSRATVVPAQAVNQGPDGAYVYLVAADDKVAQQKVTVLTTQGALAVIQSGVTPGQSVVTDGQMSLKPGSAICLPGHCGQPGGKAGGGKASGGERPA